VAYVPIDIAGEQLKASALRLAEEFPQLNIVAVCAIIRARCACRKSTACARAGA